MTQFRERNPIPIAVISLAVLAAVLALAFKAADIPLLGGGGKTYYADFADASQLKHNDDVRLAGIKIGQVTTVRLAPGDKGYVRVGMKVRPGISLGDQSQADIRIKTLLGTMYVALSPNGQRPLRGDIPTSATTTPLIVTAAFQKLSTTVGAIDVNQLATAFNTLSDDFSGTPTEVSRTLAGLSRLSTTIASRDGALQVLLRHAQGVTTALAARDAEVTKLINDGDTVLQLVNQQRDVIHQLLLNTVSFSQQVSGLVRENTAVLRPALANLQATVDILTKDQAQLDEGVHLLAPFVRDFTNTLGNGPWFDSFIANLASAAVPGCFSIAYGGAPVSQGTGTVPAGCL